MAEKTTYIYSICIILVVAVVALATGLQSNNNGITGKFSWVNTMGHYTTKNTQPILVVDNTAACAKEAYTLAERAVTWGAIRGMDAGLAIQTCKEKKVGQYGDGETFSSYNEGKFCSIIIKKYEGCLSKKSFSNEDPRRDLRERRS